MISGVAKEDKVTRPHVAGPPAPPTTEDKKGCNAMTNEQYFKLDELKHKYNQKLMEAQEANDEQDATYFSGVLNGIRIAARELLSE